MQKHNAKNQESESKRNFELYFAPREISVEDDFRGFYLIMIRTFILFYKEKFIVDSSFYQLRYYLPVYPISMMYEGGILFCVFLTQKLGRIHYLGPPPSTPFPLYLII